jgi:hypothetical protein
MPGLYPVACNASCVGRSQRQPVEFGLVPHPPAVALILLCAGGLETTVPPSEFPRVWHSQ